MQNRKRRWQKRHTQSDEKGYLGALISGDPAGRDKYFDLRQSTTSTSRYAGQFCNNDHPPLQTMVDLHCRRMYLTETEAVRLMDAPDNKRDRLLIRTILGTGIRRMEAANLRISDVDFSADLLHVVNGKGGRNRSIPLHPKLRGELLRFIQERESGPLFQRRRIEVRFSGTIHLSTVSYTIKKWAKITGLGWVSVHTLRHTFAYLCEENGMKLSTIQKMLGHAKLSTTAIYLDRFSNEVKKDFLANLFDF